MYSISLDILNRLSRLPLSHPRVGTNRTFYFDVPLNTNQSISQSINPSCSYLGKDSIDLCYAWFDWISDVYFDDIKRATVKQWCLRNGCIDLYVCYTVVKCLCRCKMVPSSRFKYRSDIRNIRWFAIHTNQRFKQLILILNAGHAIVF